MLCTCAATHHDIRGARWPRLAYIFSFYAIIDILAVAPFYIAQLVPAIDRYDNYLRYAALQVNNKNMFTIHTLAIAYKLLCVHAT
jgi:hypothetical protein